jgi:2,3-bisphosphoglycerate-independent phosphoglycerate mutase
MKYLVLLADGMADWPLPALNNQTPLQACSNPNMDRLAQQSEVGLVQTVPPGMPPGSDVANLAVLGYDPQQHYTGRSPLEAISIGVDLGPNDVAFRCNLVTLSDEPDYRAKTMIDYSSDEISTPEARELILAVAAKLGSKLFSFFPGVSYRHLMVWHGGPLTTQLTPPHDISGRPIGEYLPAGEGGKELLQLMEAGRKLLAEHPVNQKRIVQGIHPATSLWFWGQGKKPAIPSFFERFGLHGAVISAVDLTKGLGICAGLQVIDVPGATGNIHTNFHGKAVAALQAFRDGIDFVYLHIEAPDEAGHRGEMDTKIKAIERIDAEVLGYILDELPLITPEFCIMLLPDHPTPLAIKTHTADPVPFLIYRHGQNQTEYSAPAFDEKSAAATGLLIDPGHQLMNRFIAIS